MTVKRCSRCGPRPASAFRKNQRWCRSCYNVRRRAQRRLMRSQTPQTVDKPRVLKAHTKEYRQRKVGNRVLRVHRIMAEIALGHPLPMGSEVHHVDGTKSDASPLVICQDHAYHMLLHVRTRVLRAGGNPNTDRICTECKVAKPMSAFYKRLKSPSGISNQCRLCKAALYRAWRRQDKAAHRRAPCRA